MTVSPEAFDDFRRGDEPEDTRVGDFKVYGGTPTDRALLQNNDPDLLAAVDTEPRDLLGRYEAETHPGPGEN